MFVKNKLIKLSVKLILLIDIIAAISFNLSPFIHQVQAKRNRYDTPLSGFRWPSRTITYRYSKMPAKYRLIYSQAIQKWNSYRIVHFKQVKSHPDAQLMVKSLVAKNNHEDTGLTTYQYSIGIKGWFHPYGIFTHADVCLSNQVFNSCGFDHLKRVHVAEHELGHVMGLNHNLMTSKSIMLPETADSHISKYDLASLKFWYLK